VANPRMYGMLTANSPSCVVFSLLVQRRNLRCRGFQRLFPVPPRPAQRAADMEWRFEPERRPSQGHFRPGIVPDTTNRLPGREVPIRPAGFVAMPAPSATDKAVSPPPKSVQTGRRLMRQTVLPTPIQSRTAPTRSESLARHLALDGSCSARRAALRFGLPFTPESGGPSP